MGVAIEWEFFREQLPSDWRELAFAMGLVRPHPPHLKTKVTDPEPVVRLLLHRAGEDASLRVTTAEAKTGHVIDLSAPSLHEWERKLAPYFARLCAELCDAPTRFGSGRWSGYDVFVVDATVVTRPGAQGTTGRVHYVLRLATLSFVRVIVTDEHVGETLRLHETVAAPGQLWIPDRGYANPPGIDALTAAGATVLVRYNRGALPLHDPLGKPFDVLKHVRKLKKPGAIGDWRVLVYAENGRKIRGRLCAVRLSDAEAAEAREHLRAEQGADATPETLEAASWMMVFTTVPRSRMRPGRVLETYRLRWQIELEIKRDKSIGHLDKLPNFRDDTIATWMQAKVLIELVAKKIASLGEAFPPHSSTAPSTRTASTPPTPWVSHPARQPWRVNTFILGAIRSALQFVALHEIPEGLDAFLEHLERTHERSRPKQIERFHHELRPPSTGPPMSQRIAREAWRVTTLVHGAIRAALRFVPLPEVPEGLGAFLEHLGRPRETTRPTQLERFQRELRYDTADADARPVEAANPALQARATTEILASERRTTAAAKLA